MKKLFFVLAVVSAVNILSGQEQVRQQAGGSSSCSADCAFTSCTITCNFSHGGAACTCAWGFATCACGGAYGNRAQQIDNYGKLKLMLQNLENKKASAAILESATRLVKYSQKNTTSDAYSKELETYSKLIGNLSSKDKNKIESFLSSQVK